MPRMLTSRQERAARTLDIMSRWWDGERVVAMAEAHRLSRQMTYRILSSVACDWQVRRRKQARWRRYDPDPLPEVVVTEARSVAASRFFMRLTPRQRGAVAWRASGLDMLQTAERMGSFPSTVRDLLMMAYARVENLTAKAEKWHARKVEPDPGMTFAPLEIEDIIGKPVTDVK